MKCNDVKALLSKFIDNELDNKTYNMIKIHLKECDDCRNHYNEILSLNNNLKNLKSLEYNKKLENSIMQKIKDKQKKSSFIPYLIYTLTFIIIFTISLVFNLNNLNNKKSQTKIIEKMSILNYDNVKLLNLQENSFNILGEANENK